jgi:heme oxygenase (biliverdin-IX-beta and delta-forming)
MRAEQCDPFRRHEPDLHEALRAATDGVHQRLHTHRGFAAIKAETIDLPRYARLLRRLHGFHRPFEVATGLAAARSGRIAADLAALASEPALASTPIPQCHDIPVFDDTDARLGGLYVVEGAALGGRILARHLDRLFGTGAVAGRSFFLGGGSDTGATWRAFLAQLGEVSPDPARRHRVIAAAVATFAAFENWLEDWDKP